MNDTVKWLMIGVGGYLLYEWLQGSSTPAAVGTAPAAGTGTNATLPTPTSVQQLNNGPNPWFNPGGSLAPTQATLTPAQISAIQIQPGTPAYQMYQMLLQQGQSQQQATATVQQYIAQTSNLPVGSLAGMGAPHAPRQMSREVHDRLTRAHAVTRSGGTSRATNPPVIRIQPPSRARVVDKNYWGEGARSSRQISPRWVQ